eukprot:4277632-Amphidinium_carterae.1
MRIQWTTEGEPSAHQASEIERAAPKHPHHMMVAQLPIRRNVYRWKRTFNIAPNIAARAARIDSMTRRVARWSSKPLEGPWGPSSRGRAH